jgi:NAD(P)H-flavin reductase
MNLTVISIMADPPEKWTGEKGRIDQELLAEHLHARRSVRTHRAYFVCGPPMMIVAVVKVLEDLDIPPKQIYTELFGMI